MRWRVVFKREYEPEVEVIFFADDFEVASQRVYTALELLGHSLVTPDQIIKLERVRYG